MSGAHPAGVGATHQGVLGLIDEQVKRAVPQRQGQPEPTPSRSRRNKAASTAAPACKPVATSMTATPTLRARLQRRR